MEYEAMFEIDCGVSSGFGVKYPDTVERTETFSADGSKTAYQNAIHIAERFADDYLSNPNNALTTVRLLSLRTAEGKDVPFDSSGATVKRSMLEHFLALDSR